MFSRNIFIPLYLKAETSADAQHAITLLYIMLGNILAWRHLETYIEDTRRKMESQDDVMNVVT